MMTPSQTAFARWFAPMVAGVLAVVGMVGFVFITAGRNHAEAARVASSTAWASPD